MQIFIYCKVTLHVSGVTAPIIRVLKTVAAASGTGHNTGTVTFLQRGPIGLKASHHDSTYDIMTDKTCNVCGLAYRYCS